MTQYQFAFCVKETAAYTDPNAFVSDLALSSLWGDQPDGDIPAERVEELRDVWDAVNRTIREIVALSGMSQASFADLYSIPKRTVENWCTSVNKCPLYTRLLLQQAMGLLSIGRK